MAHAYCMLSLRSCIPFLGLGHKHACPEIVSLEELYVSLPDSVRVVQASTSAGWLPALPRWLAGHSVPCSLQLAAASAAAPSCGTAPVQTHLLCAPAHSHSCLIQHTDDTSTRSLLFVVVAVVQRWDLDETTTQAMLCDACMAARNASAATATVLHPWELFLPQLWHENM